MHVHGSNIGVYNSSLRIYLIRKWKRKSSEHISQTLCIIGHCIIHPFFLAFSLSTSSLCHTRAHTEKSHANKEDSEKLDMQAQPLTKLLVHWALDLAVILILTLHLSPKQIGSDKQASGSRSEATSRRPFSMQLVHRCPRRSRCSLFFRFLFLCAR